jgi:hypothetical protein
VPFISLSKIICKNPKLHVIFIVKGFNSVVDLAPLTLTKERFMTITRITVISNGQGIELKGNSATFQPHSLFPTPNQC